MILKCDEITDRLKRTDKSKLVIVPLVLEELEESGSTAVDLRLGTRFLSAKHSRNTVLTVEPEGKKETNKEQRLMESHYIQFGKEFILHPRDFVLGVTLEWIKLPSDLSGYVQGRSSWGRRGLVIATAVGVHSGFSGCLTLEITNLGEVPIAIYPGMSICQLFIHEVKTSTDSTDSSLFFGKSKPILGTISLDDTAKRLAGFNIKDDESEDEKSK